MSTFCEGEELDAHEENLCGYPKGGIPSIAVLKTGYKDHITDFTNATQWEAAIAAGKAVIAKNLKAELAEPSEVTGESVTGCGQPDTVVDGHDYDFAIIDFNVATPANPGNDTYINQLNKGTFAGVAFYNCDTDAIRVYEGRVNFSARVVIPATDREKQRYLYNAKWYSPVEQGLPVLYAAPEGIFVTV